MLLYMFIHWAGTSNIIISTGLLRNFMKFLKLVFDFLTYLYYPPKGSALAHSRCGSIDLSLQLLCYYIAKFDVQKH